MKWSWLAVAVASLVACTSASASKDALRARVTPAPKSLTTRLWSPTIALTRDGKPASARVVLTIRKGNVKHAFVARAWHAGSYRVRVVFPSDGRWSWTVAAARRVLARGSVLVTLSTVFKFDLPYDLAVAADGSLFFPDGARVLRFDPATRRVSVYATMSSGEAVALVRLADGTLFLADFPGNRIVRIDPTTRASTVASVPAPADLVSDATGTTLWVASLGRPDGVVRVDVASGRVEPFAPAERPHGIDRDREGNLFVHDGPGISRIDARTGAVERYADVDGVHLLVAPDRSVYGVAPSPAGGVVRRVAPDRTVTTVVGNWTIGPHRDGRALDAAILPAAVQFAPDGALLVTQIEPVAAIRRVDLATGTISTLVRGG